MEDVVGTASTDTTAHETTYEVFPQEVVELDSDLSSSSSRSKLDEAREELEWIEGVFGPGEAVGCPDNPPQEDLAMSTELYLTCFERVASKGLTQRYVAMICRIAYTSFSRNYKAFRAAQDSWRYMGRGPEGLVTASAKALLKQRARVWQKQGDGMTIENFPGRLEASMKDDAATRPGGSTNVVRLPAEAQLREIRDELFPLKRKKPATQIAGRKLEAQKMENTAQAAATWSAMFKKFNFQPPCIVNSDRCTFCARASASDADTLILDSDMDFWLNAHNQSAKVSKADEIPNRSVRQGASSAWSVLGAAETGGDKGLRHPDQRSRG